MKLATLRDGTPDGRLVVVSRDLTRASDARHIAPTLRAALENWEEAAAELERIAAGVETGGQPVERFHEREARAPLPRPANRAALADPRAPLASGPSPVPGLAVLTAGAPPAIRLVTLTLGAAAGPVAVTPEELGPLWFESVVIARLGFDIAGTPGEVSAPVNLAGLILASDDVPPASFLTAPFPVALAGAPGAAVRLEMRDPEGHSVFGAIETALPFPDADPRLTQFRAMARNNAWANDRLLGAMVSLDDAAFAAPRTSFFPSLRETLNHLHAVDRYYVAALEEAGRGRSAFAEAPDFTSVVELRAAQAASDRRLVAFCDRLEAADLDRSVLTDRGAEGAFHERVDALLAHIFQHQVHHRGQAHAMLAGTDVPPPQLDEFFLDYDRHPSVAEGGFLPEGLRSDATRGQA